MPPLPFKNKLCYPERPDDMRTILQMLPELQTDQQKDWRLCERSGEGNRCSEIEKCFKWNANYFQETFFLLGHNVDGGEPVRRRRLGAQDPVWRPWLDGGGDRVQEPAQPAPRPPEADRVSNRVVGVVKLFSIAICCNLRICILLG